ncbi:hypothetical protein SAMN05421764_101421 [Donghicola eburneus]|uniref:Glycine zipper family protein n=2 Tax=Donghicola eburneus TaxID=393278 RepID=A0A1M4N0W0_9RHOB|nr:hypothetical protein KARMA_1876 [Donghicola eburneus]SFQ10062.1 hypothetical protein SAMN05421764_101421 [Donghicola eburneus]
MEGYSKHFILALFAGTLLSACGDSGANYTPINDGPTTIGFQSDLAACQRLAKNQTQLTQETYGAAAIGAAAGALLSAVADDDDMVGNALGGAAILGGTVAVENQDKKEDIVINCMKGRGHAVVG